MDVGRNKTLGLPNSTVNSNDNSGLDFLDLGYRGAIHSGPIARSRLDKDGDLEDTGTAATDQDCCLPPFQAKALRHHS